MAANQSQNQSSAAETGLSDVASVRDYLQARINPAVVASLEARLCLAWPGPRPNSGANSEVMSGANSEINSRLNVELNSELYFELRQGQLTWLDAPNQAHATFWFRDAQDVGHLLSSSDTAYLDFMQRFMAAELSSDGYLPWAFTLLSLFRGGPTLAKPN